MSLRPIHHTLEAIDDWRELASRQNHGLTVSLLWSKRADSVKVTVVDWNVDEKHELRVDGADALSAFYHPFAYLAAGLDGAADASLDLQSQS